MPQEANQAAVKLCNNVEITLDGKLMPHPVAVEGLGVEAVYRDPEDHQVVGAFVNYRPTVVKLYFRLSDAKILREACGKREEILKDRTLVLRWLGENETPLTVTTLTMVRLVRLLQIKRPGEQPLEMLEFTAQQIQLQ